ncbi:transposase (plasmid) [Rhodovulum sp. P5]|nr:transposase [Rhodovulum sp. P5]
MSRPSTPTYKIKNWRAYNEALKRRGSLTIWFDPAMTWEARPTGKRGRQPTYSDAAIQTCLTMKVLFGMALRQTTGVVESLLQLSGLDWSVPGFSTLSRRQKTLNVNIPYRGSEGPLHLLIDSTGIKVEGEGEWNARKHGGAKRRIWRKVHLGIDEKTLEIRAVEFTSSDIGDAPIRRGNDPPDRFLILLIA